MPHFFSAIWTHRAALASGATLTAAAVTISTLAFFYEGIATADLELDDGGVWVTRTDDRRIGHLNYPSRLLDGSYQLTAPEFDILQDGDRVLVHAESGDTLTPIDPATLQPIGDTALPTGARVALGSGTLGVLAGGFVHAVAADGLTGVSFEEDDALAEVGAGGAVAVSKDGTWVFAVSRRDAELVAVDTATGEVHTTALEAVAADADLSLTAIGSSPVTFDEANGVVYLPNGSRVEVPGGADGRLQQSSAENDAVYVATPRGLYRQPLGGGEMERVAEVEEGGATAPVWLNGCLYSVWSGSGSYVRDCVGDDSDLNTTLEVPATSTLALRTNRRVVVVNDLAAGTVWVASDQVERVDNWDDTIPPPEDEAEEEESQEEEPFFDIPERSAENNPPTAVDDQYGARPGRTVLLKVTENDTDPDGDLLSASLVGEAPAGYTVTPVLGGSALQVAVPANASGSESLRYVADDGRGGTDEAIATVGIREPGQNGPPELERPRTVQVEVNASVTYPALEGWKDPDGDDLYLKSATVEGGDVLTFRTNGVIEYTASSGVVGLKEVALVVSDGEEDAEGILRVDVRPAGSLDPVANADRVTATAGVPITVSPLANDVSPTGEPLRLSKVEPAAGARVTPDHAAGTFEFSADRAGVYYVQYLVTLGTRSALGIIRVDVVAEDAGNLPPVAVRDVALLPSGRDVLVDVLANDSDPGGGILVVQSARAPAGTGVSVEVLQHSILRVTDLAGLRSPVVLSYTVSNGAQTAVGEVLVMPVPLPEKLSPPVAVDDAATVRVGDVVSIPVLGNDYHPDNDAITLVPQLVETNVGDGEVFVDGERIRFQAGEEPGTAYVTYEIEDSQRQRAAAYITIQVIPADAGTNAAPRAKPVTARVIAGNTVRIPIPLDGIDPDGDSVELVGASSNPSKGRVTVGDTWLTYEAFADEYGRDSFTYLVRDRLGAVAESTVTVGVAAPGVDNQAPYAVKDTVIVKPGRRVAVPVTVNDSDPDGDEILIVTDGLTAPAGVNATIVAGRVSLTAPREPGDYTITYTIADTFGATAEGVLLVVVDPEAPVRAPIARDDRVSPLSIGSAETVKVRVLENDEDPDGTIEDLSVTVFDANADVRAGGVVEVELEPGAQIIRYAITDQDGQVGQAFVFVPGLSALAPVLATTEPIVVTSGETVSIPLADHVHVRSGRVPRVAVADSVRTNHSDGAPLITDEFTLAYTSAAGYYGPDSVGVLVTDGTGPDDPEGLTGYVSIPIQVLPAENQSPKLRGATVSVAPGEDAVTINLAKLASDPDPGDLAKLTFAIEGEHPAGYSASVSGTTLTVSAEPSVEPGTSATLTISASDGTSAPGTGTITMIAVTSQRPFPVANDDVIPRADQGASRTVDVLANDFNPFEGEAPLTVVSARVDTPGRHTAEVSGDKVVVTPDAAFHGSLIVTYRIADATKAADREVDGRIVFTVQGRPDAPGVPTVTSVQDRTVVLSWAPPSNNGSPITSYEVTSQNGYAKTCASTTCTLDGLTNDVEYTFRVVAINEVGESDPSPMSAVARPDARPDTPAPPSLVFGDKSLQVAWTTPHSTGSPVQSYDLEISPAPATGPIQKAGVTGNALTWEGLENGVAYQVRVRAANRAPEKSEWSPYSATMVPAGIPDAPGQPQTAPASPVGAQAQIAVSWAAPASDNGDAVSGYTLNVKRGGSVLQSIPVVGTSQNVVVDTSETDYTFSVTARNKAGDSAASADSAPRRGATAPGAPAAVTLTPADRSVIVAFTPGPLNGNRAGEMTYYYRINQTGAQGTLPAGGGTIGGLTNGTSYTVNVWGASSVQGVSPGPEAGSAAAVPFGAPIITNFVANRENNAVRFTWNVNGNGRPLTASSHAIDGAGNGSYTVGGLAPGQSTTLNLSYTNAGGTSTASQSGSANDPPPPRAYLTRNSSQEIVVNTENFPAGSYRFNCYENGEAFTDNNGNTFNFAARDFSANGTTTTPCWVGSGRGTITVRIFDVPGFGTFTTEGKNF